VALAAVRCYLEAGATALVAMIGSMEAAFIHIPEAAFVHISEAAALGLLIPRGDHIFKTKTPPFSIHFEARLKPLGWSSPTYASSCQNSSPLLTFWAIKAIRVPSRRSDYPLEQIFLYRSKMF
jgi:hypothetical protein